jgi:hypothetical protein
MFLFPSSSRIIKRRQLNIEHENFLPITLNSSYAVNLSRETTNFQMKFHHLIRKYDSGATKTTDLNFDVLLTLHLSIFISIFNQIDAQNLFHSKFYFMPVHVLSTFAHHQEVKIA